MEFDLQRGTIRPTPATSYVPSAAEMFGSSRVTGPSVPTTPITTAMMTSQPLSLPTGSSLPLNINITSTGGTSLDQLRDLLSTVLAETRVTQQATLASTASVPGAPAVAAAAPPLPLAAAAAAAPISQRAVPTTAAPPVMAPIVPPGIVPPAAIEQVPPASQGLIQLRPPVGATPVPPIAAAVPPASAVSSATLAPPAMIVTTTTSPVAAAQVSPHTGLWQRLPRWLIISVLGVLTLLIIGLLIRLIRYRPPPPPPSPPKPPSPPTVSLELTPPAQSNSHRLVDPVAAAIEAVQTRQQNVANVQSAEARLASQRRAVVGASSTAAANTGDEEDGIVRAPGGASIVRRKTVTVTRGDNDTDDTKPPLTIVPAWSDFVMLAHAGSGPQSGMYLPESTMWQAYPIDDIAPRRPK